jgi:hypothetical protein
MRERLGRSVDRSRGRGEGSEVGEQQEPEGHEDQRGRDPGRQAGRFICDTQRPTSPVTRRCDHDGDETDTKHDEQTRAGTRGQPRPVERERIPQRRREPPRQPTHRERPQLEQPGEQQREGGEPQEVRGRSQPERPRFTNSLAARW